MLRSKKTKLQKLLLSKEGEPRNWFSCSWPSALITRLKGESPPSKDHFTPGGTCVANATIGGNRTQVVPTYQQLHLWGYPIATSGHKGEVARSLH